MIYLQASPTYLSFLALACFPSYHNAIKLQSPSLEELETQAEELKAERMVICYNAAIMQRQGKWLKVGWLKPSAAVALLGDWHGVHRITTSKGTLIEFRREWLTHPHDRNAKACNHCGIPLPRGKRRYCSACRIAPYCNKECQAADRKDHRPVCKTKNEICRHPLSPRDAEQPEGDHMKQC